MKKGKLIPEKELLFSAYAENWWVWDKCDYVKAKLLRSEEGKPQISKGYARDRRKDLMNYILPEFGNSRLSNISSARVEKWLFKLTETTTLAHATINHILSCLRIMLSEAKRFGYIHHNPCDSVKSLALNKKARGILTIDEVKKLFSGNALEEIWGGDLLHYTINMLAATTGLRRGSSMAIREENYFGNYIHIEHSYGDFGLGPTKTRDKIDVPVPKDDIRYALYAALEKIGIKEEERKERNIVFHSWRHFFNTYCRRLNIPDPKIQKVTVHKTIGMLDNYTHFEVEDFEEVMKAQEMLLA